MFRSAVSNFGFTSGINYWEIIADSRTENELKIGVSLSRDFDMNSAFCDHSFGFAYYGKFLLIFRFGPIEIQLQRQWTFIWKKV